MPATLADKLYHLKPQVGDTTPHDETGVNPDLSGGTFSLVDISGEPAWRHTGAQATATFAQKILALTGPDGGITIVARFRIANYGTTEFSFFISVGDGANASETSVNGLGVGRNGVNDLRWRAITGAGAPDLTVGTSLRTHVCRIRTGTTQDWVEAWIDTVGRVGTTPDQTSSAATMLGLTANTLRIQTASTSVLEIAELAIINGELSDADSVAVADDISLLSTGPEEYSGSGTLVPASSLSGSGTYLSLPFYDGGAALVGRANLIGAGTYVSDTPRYYDDGGSIALAGNAYLTAVANYDASGPGAYSGFGNLIGMALLNAASETPERVFDSSILPLLSRRRRRA